MRAELADGRVLEFPDGTDPTVIQATVRRLMAPAPSATEVAINSANKGIAGVGDALLNTPANVINLAKAAVGAPLAAAGRPDLAPELSAPPNYATRAMKAMGFIRDEAEPQTTPQKFLDAGVQGGVGALAGPANSGKQAVINALMGIAGGEASQGVKEAGGSDNAALSAAMLTQFAPAAAQRAVMGKPVEMTDVKRQTLENAREAGYVVPGSETNTGWINRRIEDVAGKAAVKQEAAAKNQATTNKNIADEIGVDPKSITSGALESRRYDLAEPYREISAMSPAAAKNLEILKQVRSDATAQWNFFRRSGNPEAQAKAKALSQQADMIEGVIDTIAVRRGDPDLVDRLRAARQDIAKTHDAERSMNSGSGDISAPDLGRMLDKKPLSGALETTGRFAQAYPRYATEGATVPPPDVSKANAIASVILGTMGGNVGFQAGGAPGALAGATMAGLPYLSGPLRSMVLSKSYQEALGKSGKNPREAEIRALLVGRALAEAE